MFEVKNLDWLEILEKIKSFTTCEAGRDIIAETKSLASVAEAEKSFYEIECAAAVILSNLVSSFISEKEEEQEFSATTYGTKKTLKEIIAERKASKESALPPFELSSLEDKMPPSLLESSIKEKEQEENLDLEDYPDDEELSEGEEDDEF